MRLASSVLQHLAPRLLWRLRVQKWNVERTEAEMELLPALCDPHRASVDVGAAAGAYTMYMLGHSARCHVFEPRPESAARLRELFAGANVSVEEVALSDAAGEAEFRVCDDDPGRSTLHAENTLSGVGGVRAIRVARRPLDSYALRDVGFVKIDVEGHELAVLRGAEETLARERPTLLVEAEERHAPDAVRTLDAHMRAHGYAGYFLDHAGLRPIAEFRREVHQDVEQARRGGRYVNNFVFVPDRAAAARLARRAVEAAAALGGG